VTKVPGGSVPAGADLYGIGVVADRDGRVAMLAVEEWEV